MPGFNFQVPKALDGIDSKIFMPIQAWNDHDEYNKTANKLATQFQRNFKKYTDGTPESVIQNGGPKLDVDYRQF
jgi:phosphoenolpyruvate carboxykinase (ATP)